MFMQHYYRLMNGPKKLSVVLFCNAFIDHMSYVSNFLFDMRKEQFKP